MPTVRSYIGITPGCAASESGVTLPELLKMFHYGYLERLCIFYYTW